MAGPTNQGAGFSEQQRRQESSGSGAMSTVKDKAQEAMDTAREKAQEFAARAGDAWDSTRQSAQQMASRVAGEAENAWDSASDFMRRYPIPTFLVGVGLGFLLAQAFRNLSTDMTRRMSYASERER